MIQKIKLNGKDEFFKERTDLKTTDSFLLIKIRDKDYYTVCNNLSLIESIGLLEEYKFDLLLEEKLNKKMKEN